MKLLFQRDSVLAALQSASSAIPAREVKPVLQNFKASANGSGSISVTATNLELGCRVEVAGVQIQEPGEVLLRSDRIVSILRELSGDIALEAGQDGVTIRSESAEFHMPGEDPSAFPDIPTFTEDKFHEVPADTMRMLIRRTAFAAADGETARFAMTGVLCELDGDQIRMVATDGRRLAHNEGIAKPTGGHTTKGQLPLIPVKALDLLARNLGDDGPVKVCLRPNEALFQTSNAVIYTRLVDGRFPDYRQVFPKGAPRKLNISVGALHAAVRQAAIMADHDTRRVSFKFTSGLLTLHAQGAMSGRSRVELAVPWVGEAVEVLFQPEFVADVCKVLDADSEVEVGIVDGKVPVVFSAGADSKFIVMPLS